MNRYPKKYGGQLSWHKINIKRFYRESNTILTLSQERFKNFQKKKGFYGQLKTLLLKASILTLERRLEVLLFRAHWVTSLYEARFWIKQGYISLNGLICKNKNKICNPGDTILLLKRDIYPSKLRQISSKLKKVKETSQKLNFLEKLPEYIEVDWRIPSITLLTLPSYEVILLPTNISPYEI